MRDALIDKWNETQQYHTSLSPKRVYYLSLEFLIGRSFDNAMLNLNLKHKFESAVSGIGFNLSDFRI
jgi:starch phosphorylase